MSAGESRATLRKQDLHRSTTSKYRDSKHSMRESQKTSAASSGKSSADEIARLQEIIVHLQKEREHSQKSEGSSFDTEEDLRWKLNRSEKEKLDIITKYNEEISRYESQVAKLRAQLEKGEAIRQNVEYEIALVRKDAGLEKCTAEERMANLYQVKEQLKAQNEEMQQRIADLQNALHISQKAREEDQHVLQSELEERDRIIQTCNTDTELLSAERDRLEEVLQGQEETLMNLHKKLMELEMDQNKDEDALRRQASELEYSAEREERLKKELETALQRVKNLDENVESERAAHLESKFNSEIIQLRIRDLEAALQVEKSSHAEAVSNFEMIKQQFREVEKAYKQEKENAQQSIEKLQRFENDSSSLSKQISQEIEQYKKEIADLSEKLQGHEKTSAELEMANERKAYFQEAYESCMRELELLLHHCNMSGLRTSGERDKEKPQNFTVIIENLRRTLTCYQDRFEDTSNELVQMTKECQLKEETIQAQNKEIEEAQQNLSDASNELSELRSECADREALVGKAEMELQNMRHHWETEKMRAMEAENEIQKLTQVHQKDSEEKLTFLHNLYQHLVAGCVLIKQPEGLLGRFSWSELCTVLQEHVDALTSDLHRANEKISHLEYVCKNRDDAVKELQQTQENMFCKLAKQVKGREAGWQKQKKDLEQHYSALIGEVHARAQNCQGVADKANEKVASLEKIRDQMALELLHLKQVLPGTQRENAALLSACALMAGALYPLYCNLCAISSQKDMLLEQVNATLAFKNQIETLVLALSSEDKKEEKRGGNVPRLQSNGLIKVFRKGVIAVIAARRFQRLGKASRYLFSWADGFQELPGLTVHMGWTKPSQQSKSKNKENKHGIQALKWFTSSDLLAIVVSSMMELQDTISKTDPSAPSASRILVSAAQSSFSKLMDRLRVEMDNGSGESAKPIRYGEKGTLVRRLAHGLHKLNSRMLKAGMPATVPMKQTVSILQGRILEFTQRLHAAEVERRNLRMELSQFKRSMNEMRKEADKALGLKEKLKEFKQAAMVPLERFENVCEELNSALLRQQQAQMLLHEQAQQLQELGLRLEQHSGEEAEKDQTLTEAVKSLSEAKMELRRKDQSLRQLRKHLSQLEQDKRRLEESIRDAESALCMAAKSKDFIAGYMNSVEGSVKEVNERLSLSWTAAAKNDFTLQVPKYLETFGAEGLKGGPEVVACQNFITSFMDLYQLACSKISTLETELSSHQQHIAALKSELQTACLRDNEEFLPA
ncbi:coiled-coil domain-containing protein 171-like isoform X2 [Acipenser ruthenus]|uniref:coiled-coil domain-containing protein 171-like isoform X2 n=1 Tax=Acipenser ruthenus TaxID=7906 RepID=UPI0027427978|nr:coiled-coil domain-containing protein 171-like isoform X2 [Acipenser ruthenus]